MPAATELGFPLVPGAATREPTGVLVMRFGEHALADVDGIHAVAHRLVAAREAGHGVVGVLGALGSATSELLQLARDVSPRPHERELDMLVSMGERAACALTAMAIVDLGHDAVSLTGSQAGIVTDSAHGRARIVEVRPRRVQEALERGAIVLVAGFQGVSTDSEVTTLGPGGRDATAVALAAALGADACELLEDVEGIASASPDVVASARTVPVVSHDELLELAATGGADVQLRSLQLSRDQRVPLHVRSSLSADEGTWVVSEEDWRMLERAIISGVSHTIDDTVYRVDGVAPAALFSALAEADVVVDTILQTADGLVFSAPTADDPATERVLGSLGARFTADAELGQVSVVGAGMRSHPGVAATAFATLEENGIEPVIVTTSPIRISCHVRRDSVERAVRALHDAFELDREEERAGG
jgi:aspartate kinase